jgi:hypothetical protein
MWLSQTGGGGASVRNRDVEPYNANIKPDGGWIFGDLRYIIC